MKQAFVETTSAPDAMGIARHRIVLHTPGQPMTVMFWRGDTGNVVRELQGAGYVINGERASA